MTEKSPVAPISARISSSRARGRAASSSRVDVADPPVVTSGPAERDLGQPADVDRDRRGGGGVHHHPRRGVELTLELGPARLPERLHQRQALVGTPAAGVEVLAEQVELLAAPADADAQRDPVARQHGRGADRLGDLERAAQRGHVDAGEEPHPAWSPPPARRSAPTGPASRRRGPSVACRRRCRGTASPAPRGRRRGRAPRSRGSRARPPPWRAGSGGRSAGRPSRSRSAPGNLEHVLACLSLRCGYLKML